MTVPSITALPPAPDRADPPDTFADEADTFVAALATFRTELNNVGTAINDALAGALVTYAGYAGTWSAGTYAEGEVVLYTDDLFYISLADSNTDEPPSANWQALNGASSVSYDNTYSNLTATDVQAAIDELEDASAIQYDPSGVALTATTVQGAVDQLCTLPIQGKSANYTLQASDAGGLIRISDGTITVPSGVFSEGDTVVIYNNNTSTSRTISRASGVTMYWIGPVDANRTLLPRGLATLVCVGTNTFVITGQGLS